MDEDLDRPGKIVLPPFGDHLYHIPSTYRIHDTTRDGHRLSQVLSGASSVPYKDENEFAKYRSTVTTQAKVSGVYESSTKNIEYNVGVPGARGNIDTGMMGFFDIAGDIVVPDSYQKDIQQAARRQPALPNTFTTMNLLSIAERLAMGMAHFSTWGALTAVELRGGQNWNVRSIQAAEANIATAPGSLYITNRLCDYRYPATLCAIIAAANGEDVPVYTDLVTIDSQGTVQLRTYDGAELARGAYEGLMMIMQLYNECNAGPECAMAIAYGIHKAKTMVGHTDEGGFVRRVFRTGRYTPPHGAILLREVECPYYGMFDPGRSVGGFRKLVDSILLGTSAAVAMADPMVKINGKRYPTIISLNGKMGEAGTVDKTPLSTSQASLMQQAWANAATEWAVNYVYLVGKLFGAVGSTMQAVNQLTTKIDGAAGTKDRHLEVRCALAFFLVEPTSIWPYKEDDVATTHEMCGPLAYEGMTMEYTPFAGPVNTAELGASGYVVKVDYRFARRHAILLHLEQHKQNGMTNIKLFSGDPHRFALTGSTTPMEDLIMGGGSLDRLMWGRLHSQLIVPGEVCNLNDHLAFAVETNTFNLGADGWDGDVNHVPTRYDLKSPIRVNTARPRAVGMGQLVVKDSHVTRSLTDATVALKNARAHSIRGDRLGGVIRPMIGEPMQLGLVEEPPDVIVEMMLARADEETTDRLVMHHEVGNPDAATVERGERKKGNIVPIVIHNVSARGRQLPRSGGGAVMVGGYATQQPDPDVSRGYETQQQTTTAIDGSDTGGRVHEIPYTSAPTQTAIERDELPPGGGSRAVPARDAG